MMDCWLRSRHSFRPLLVNAGESHKRRNVLNAIPRRERGEVQAELDGIWSQPTKPEAVAQLASENRQVQQTLSRSGEKSG
jgi:transposase-like protein